MFNYVPSVEGQLRLFKKCLETILRNSIKIAVLSLNLFGSLYKMSRTTRVHCFLLRLGLEFGLGLRFRLGLGSGCQQQGFGHKKGVT